MSQTRLRIEFDREEDGRWIAEVAELPGVLALRVLADRLEHGKAIPEKLLSVSFT